MNRYKIENFLIGSNSSEALKLISKLVKDGLNICVTGGLNAGKTTLMKSLLKYVDDLQAIKLFNPNDYNDLVPHFPEKNLIVAKDVKPREYYYNLGILVDPCIRTTCVFDELSSTERLRNYFTESLACGSGLFMTHEASNSHVLVNDLANRLLSSNLITDIDVALKLVLDYLAVNINLVKSPQKGIYLNRISLITPVSYDSKDFEVRDILTYDLDSNKYDIKLEVANIGG